MRIYTRTGDDGRTALFRGGRVWKNDPAPAAYGAVDEAVAALGAARAQAAGDLAERVLAVQRDLFVVAAELATDPSQRSQLEPGVSIVTQDMVKDLEPRIDEMVEAHGLPTEFVVPGENPAAAALDVARTTLRRAEREAVALARAGGLEGSFVLPYLNRAADYVYVLARAAAPEWQPSRRQEGP